MFYYSKEINRSRSKDYALFNRWTRSLLLNRVFKSSFNESDSELKESSFSSSSVTTISSLSDSDSFVLEKKESDSDASSSEEEKEEELWIEEESESEENIVERVTCFPFDRR